MFYRIGQVLRLIQTSMDFQSGAYQSEVDLPSLFTVLSQGDFMSYGFEVTINGTQVRLDDEYQNIVLLGKKTIHLSAGYQEISLSEFAHENLTTCIRHLGIGVSFFGYIYSSGKKVGLRLYASGAGSAQVALFVPFFPIPEQGYGVILYGGSGDQRFHSNHIYFDVKNTGNLSSSSINTDQDMYVLSNPETPLITFTPHVQLTQLPVYGQEAYEICSTNYRYVTVCNYTSTGQVCEQVLEPYQVCNTFYRQVIVGYRTESYNWVTSTKIIALTYQDTNGKLSKSNITLKNEETVYTEINPGRYDHFIGLSFPVISTTITNPPANALSFASPTITIKAIV